MRSTSPGDTFLAGSQQKVGQQEGETIVNVLKRTVVGALFAAGLVVAGGAAPAQAANACSTPPTGGPDGRIVFSCTGSSSTTSIRIYYRCHGFFPDQFDRSQTIRIGYGGSFRINACAWPAASEVRSWSFLKASAG